MYLTFMSTISTNSLKLYLGNRGDKWLFLDNWRLENIVSVLDHFFGITGKVEFFALVDAKKYN